MAWLHMKRILACRILFPVGLRRLENGTKPVASSWLPTTHSCGVVQFRSAHLLRISLVRPCHLVKDLLSDSVSYTVDFDTGSSDLFVPSESCDSSCSGHRKYDPSASSTSQYLGKSFSLAYGDGSTVDGKQYADDVTISGLVVRGAVFLFLSFDVLTCLAVGEGSDAWRCKHIFCGFRNHPFRARRPDGHGFQVHIGLFSKSTIPNSYL